MTEQVEGWVYGDYWINKVGNTVPLGAPPELIAKVEATLGVKLPEEYLKTMQIQNGGLLRYCVHANYQAYCCNPNNPQSSSWEQVEHTDLNPYEPIENLILLSDISAQGWNIQVEGLDLLIVLYNCDGHQYLCFDYRSCGPHGEPSLIDVHVDGQEMLMASSFRISDVQVDRRTYAGW